MHQLPSKTREAICSLMQSVVSSTSDQERTLLCSTVRGYLSALRDANIVDDKAHEGLKNWLMVLSKPGDVRVTDEQLRDDLEKITNPEKNASPRTVMAFDTPSVLIGLLCLGLGFYSWFCLVLGVALFANESFFAYTIHKRRNAPAS
jgi:hypothetical protein